MKLSVRAHMRDASRQVSFYLGLLLIIGGLVFNKWLIEATIVPDGNIESSVSLATIAMIQAAMVILGVYLAIRLRMPRKSEGGNLEVNVLILITSLLGSFLIAEMSARLLYSQSVLAFRDYRAQARDLYEEGLPAQFDNLLGWIPRTGYSSTSNKWNTQVTILADGVRSNGHERNRTGQDAAILAVGDSYTFGDEVSDDETWPAILEELLGEKVINGGVFAYGTDQSYIRMKELVPIYLPKTIIYSFIPQDIKRSEYATSLGVNKPYYDVDNNSLVLKNVPVEEIHGRSRNSFIYRALGHSYVIHRTMMVLNPNGWLIGRKWNENHTGNRGEVVTCILFRDLSNFAEEYNVDNVYVLIQDTGNSPFPGLQDEVDFVIDCIDQNRITVIDLRGALFEIKMEDPKRYETLFEVHMTYSGNYFVAESIAEAIQ